MHVLLLATITLDGKIARDASQFTNWSSREDKRLFQRTSKEAGVVIMGRATFETLPVPLPGRLNVVMTRDAEAAKARHAQAEGVEFTDEGPAAVLARLEARGYTTAVLGGGAQIYRAFLEAGLVDDVWLTVEPRVFGEGISLFGDAPLDQRFTLLEVERLGEQGVHLRYRVRREGDG
ncbi:MAG: dihydrofolate reductase family protein [Ktedonobacterales bacterium]